MKKFIEKKIGELEVARKNSKDEKERGTLLIKIQSYYLLICEWEAELRKPILEDIENNYELGLITPDEKRQMIISCNTLELNW